MKGRFNEFGGQYVPETLMNALKELEDEFYKALDDKSFIDEYKYYLKDFVGRPSPLYFADNMTEEEQEEIVRSIKESREEIIEDRNKLDDILDKFVTDLHSIPDEGH